MNLCANWTTLCTFNTSYSSNSMNDYALWELEFLFIYSFANCICKLSIQHLNSATHTAAVVEQQTAHPVHFFQNKLTKVSWVHMQGENMSWWGERVSISSRLRQDGAHTNQSLHGRWVAEGRRRRNEDRKTLMKAPSDKLQNLIAITSISQKLSRVNSYFSRQNSSTLLIGSTVSLSFLPPFCPFVAINQKEKDK